ncbi:MAG: serine hydrolase [Saprospiraceae bacterium]|nr:serine hydrolase [Candidatus Opimibacter iunctus]
MKIQKTILFLLLSATVFGQKNALPEELTKSINERIATGTNTSIVVGVIDKNGPQYYSFGTKTIGGMPVDEHTIYEIGSVSKTFTATLLADNIIKGKMKADDPISQYLPATVHVPVYSGGGAPITLGNLSDHTSGLPRMPTNFAPADPANPFADYTVERMYAFLSSYALTRAVGSEFEYSNFAVGLLGQIEALAAGKSYEEILAQVITDPLKMKETGITLSDKMKSNLATGYSMGQEVENWDLGSLQGAGAIRSSAHDMLIYLSANMGLTRTPLEAAMTLAHTPRHDKAGGSLTGLGWFTEKGSQGDIIWHNGATGGYMSFAGFNVKTGKGVVVLTNTDSGVDDIGMHVLNADAPLKDIKPQVSFVLKQIIEKDGAKGLVEKYNQLKADNPGKYDINENALNTLGYQYLGKNEIDAAEAVFKINVIEFPQSSNVYDSYGEALLKNGHKEEAVTNYKKSLDLNPGNANAIDVLAGLGETYKQAEVKVDQALLQRYTGTYELVPGFNIEISRDGDQLYAQATGQPRFEIYPKSDTEFYLKVVEAQIIFSADAEGMVSMALHQNGQVMPGKKVK